MITVKVTYTDNTSYTTSINATLEDARQYLMSHAHVSEVYSHEKGDFVEVKREVKSVELE